MTQKDWDSEFDRYKASPEFRRVNSGMTVNDFKFIYWMEYAHRMWGRSIGIVFGLPAIYFFIKGAITAKLGRRLGLLMLMGGTQGVIGWWMVKSGLEEPRNDTAVPRVSPYRLATHLASAFAIYSMLFWTTLSLKMPVPLLHAASSATQSESQAVRRWLIPLGMLVALTGSSGAFVAGNDAGRCYNTFPKMNGTWIPEDYYSTSWLSKEHFFENSAAVQLHHRQPNITMPLYSYRRVLALTTVASCVTVFLASRRYQLPSFTRHSLAGLAITAASQATLGISALLYHVPVWLGSAHQAGALVLFSFILSALHSLRPVHPSQVTQWLSRFGPSITAVGIIAAGMLITHSLRHKHHQQQQ